MFCGVTLEKKQKKTKFTQAPSQQKREGCVFVKYVYVYIYSHPHRGHTPPDYYPDFFGGGIDSWLLTQKAFNPRAVFEFAEHYGSF